jgi:hypothetical protein
VTAASFRKLALGFPGVVEQAHMGHPDFRVGGRIFATLGYPRAGWAAVSVTAYDQDALVTAYPKTFIPVKGKWGEQGATNIVLRHATAETVTVALSAAYSARLAKSRRARGKRP